jgi:hypothetical protein
VDIDAARSVAGVTEKSADQERRQSQQYAAIGDIKSSDKPRRKLAQFHAAIRCSSVRRTLGLRSGWRRRNSVSKPIVRMPGADLSIGTISLSQ